MGDLRKDHNNHLQIWNQEHKRLTQARVDIDLEQVLLYLIAKFRQILRALTKLVQLKSSLR